MKTSVIKFTQILLVFLVGGLFVFVFRNPEFFGYTENPFSLYSKDTINRTVGVLVALDRGKREKAEAVFEGIKKEILDEEFRGKHTVHQRAMLTYFLVRIQEKGLDVAGTLIESIEPITMTQTDISRMWHYLTYKKRRELIERGIDIDVWFVDLGDWVPPSKPTPDVSTLPYPCLCCGYNEDTWEYALWKMGKGPKPVKGRWSRVP